MAASTSHEYNVARPYDIWSWESFMSEALYMSEIEEILEGVSKVACRKEAVPEILKSTKEAATVLLISHYGLNPEDAESEVAAACGEEP